MEQTTKKRCNLQCLTECLTLLPIDRQASQLLLVPLVGLHCLFHPLPPRREHLAHLFCRIDGCKSSHTHDGRILLVSFVLVASDSLVRGNRSLHALFLLSSVLIASSLIVDRLVVAQWIGARRGLGRFIGRLALPSP